MSRHERGNELTDQDLLQASVTDPEAFGQFYDRHFNAVLGYFCRRVNDPHRAADLTAETFAKALLKCSRFNPKLGTPTAWLFAIARHELLGMYRKDKVSDRALQKLKIRHVSVDDVSLERIEALIDANAKIVDLREALDQLSPAIVSALTLRVGHGLTFGEVASELGCTEGAARVRVARGLSKLAAAVGA